LTAGWGEKAILDCAKILDQVKSTVTSDLPADVERMAQLEELKVQASSPIPVAGDDVGDDDALSVLSEPPPILREEKVERDEFELPPMKKAKGEMSLEEYEAMLDAEDEPGGFLEGGDIIV
jgi:hypothetical protein